MNLLGSIYGPLIDGFFYCKRIYNIIHSLIHPSSKGEDFDDINSLHTTPFIYMIQFRNPPYPNLR
jgi:hypothetical protein